MDTTKLQKESKTCKNCGLEDEDTWETDKHQSSMATYPPCKFCERNPENPENIVSDFFSENWVADFSSGELKAIIEDPTARDKALLGLLKYAREFYGDV